MVSARNLTEKKEIELVKDQLCSEINIKEVKVIDDESNILIKEIKPNYKNLGPKYGPQLRGPYFGSQIWGPIWDHLFCHHG